MSMNNYIFLTNEGYTFGNGTQNEEDQYDNAQVLGITKGNTSEEAFNNLLAEYEYLKRSTFKEIYCYELKNDYENNKKIFNLK